MSPLLFDLYLEPLCRNIITNNEIQGFRLHSCEVKLLAYADDLVLVCTNKPSIENAMLCVSNFCAVSGAAVNNDKSSGSWCGEWGTTPSKYVDIQWSTTKPHILGVPLSAMDNPKPMWDAVRKNVKAAANMWSSRYLSTFGRVAVCNIFLLSKLTYLLQVMHCSRLTVNVFNRIMATFIWRSRTIRANEKIQLVPTNARRRTWPRPYIRKTADRKVEIFHTGAAPLFRVVQTILFEEIYGISR